MTDSGLGEVGAGDAGPVRIVVLRTPRVRLLVFFLLPVVVVALFALGDRPLRGLFALVSSLALIGLAFRLRARVVLRPDRIFVINVRSWQVPWSEVTDVRVGPKGARGIPSVFVSTAEGRRELLALRSLGDTDRVKTQGAVVEQRWKETQDRPGSP